MSLEYIQMKFNQTYDEEDYTLLRTSFPTIGIWDDHDYGVNNGGTDNQLKDLVRDIYLDFIEEPKNSQRRLQKKTGLYQDYIINKEGIKVHVILIDVRYDYNKTSSDRFGEEQLDWLDHAFASNRDSTITIIGSGVQIIPDRWSPIECLSWQNKKHLINLIRKYEKSGVIFISGDVHFSQLYSMKCQSLTGFDIPELTSSGMTHNTDERFSEMH